MPMSEDAREVLLTFRGQVLTRELVKNTMADICPGCKAERAALLAALDSGVAAELATGPTAGDPSIRLSRLAQRLEQDGALTADAARWAVESLALFHGLVTDSEVLGGQREAEEQERRQLQEEQRRRAEQRDRDGHERPGTSQKADGPWKSDQNQRCRLAIWSLALGLLSPVTCAVTAIPAIICGHIALAHIRRSGGGLRGAGLARWGLCLGYGTIAILGCVLLPALSQARERARRINCQSNLKQIAIGMMLFADEHKQQFPGSFRALFEEDLWVGRAYICPSTATATPGNAGEVDALTSYLYFGTGLTMGCRGHSPASTILACDRFGNHRGFVNVLFADGHVKGFAGEFASTADLAQANGLYLPHGP